VWAADLLHTGAAGVWFGGLVLLVAVLVRRRREGRPANAAYAAVRFSTLAGAGLALAGLAGVVLAVIVLPAPSALWTSTWGLLLLAKVVLVGAVALMGAHNHLRLIPRLQADLDAAAATGGSRGLRDDPPLARDAPGGIGTAVRAERAPATHVSRDERVSAALRRNALAETTVLVVVVVLTAVLVAVSAS
jgi:putative copper export protein